jgi:ribonuclease E
MPVARVGWRARLPHGGARAKSPPRAAEKILMTRKMLIDAAHAEETRVVVLDGTRVEEFDFESQSRKQLRGNIYLAKVTRVEPSLQAAFVEYGGNRHGFLAFNDIHPDYFQIPLADREALMREAAESDDDETTSGAASHGVG